MFLLLCLSIVVLIYVYYEDYRSRKENRAEGRMVGLWNRNERRRFKRLPASLTIGYEISGKPTPLKEICSRDISQGGIGLIIYEKLREGTLLRIWVDIPERKEKLFILGKIAWQKEVTQDSSPKRVFYAGVCFTTLDTPTQLHLLNFISSLESKEA
ncbi:MAG: PilZ domain-containing protein [Candidatus Omnitrophica bacterium]|nr:PilZ domain-containing protein [Candidatus Omnitrophota bacterium]